MCQDPIGSNHSRPPPGQHTNGYISITCATVMTLAGLRETKPDYVARKGRTEAPGEDKPGGFPVAVISYRMWQNRRSFNPEQLEVGRRP